MCMDEWKKTGPERMGMDIGTKCRGNLPHVRGGDMKMMVDLEGIEPTAYCVQGNRSPN